MDSKLNVLLVDDSRTVLEQLEGMLSSIDGVAVVGLAQSGAAAIRMTNESRPDLVLMDILMPGGDGLSALRTIRSLHPEIHVAMVSSVGGDVEKAEEAFKLGACQVIAKPFDADLIESLIEQVRRQGHAVSARDLSLDLLRRRERCIVDAQIAPLDEPQGAVIVSLVERTITSRLDEQAEQRNAGRSAAVS